MWYHTRVIDGGFFLERFPSHDLIVSLVRGTSTSHNYQRPISGLQQVSPLYTLEQRTNTTGVHLIAQASCMPTRHFASDFTEISSHL